MRKSDDERLKKTQIAARERLPKRDTSINSNFFDIVIEKFSKILTAIVILIAASATISAQKNVPFVITKKINGAELKFLVKSADKKPVLLNFWATWCGPCRVEFPDLVAIDRDYREKGLNFSLVSVDDFAVIDTRVPEFLREYGATMPSYLIDLPNRAQIARAVRQIAPDFIDRFPLTLLFDANGKLVYRKVGVIDAKILRKEIDKVLIKK